MVDEKMRRRLVPISLWTAAAYIWILPLFRPRGVYGWGHFRLFDIYVGVPLLCAATCATVYAIGTHRHQLALRLASIFVSTLVTVVILDLVYAIGFQGLLRSPEPADFWFDGTLISRNDNIPDNELGFSRKPGVLWQGLVSPGGRYLSYRSDERGFRNEPGIQQADIVFVGDSFTEAVSVPEEETFVQQLGKKLNRQVVNLGRGYYGPQQELIVLRRYGLSFNPRVVVWQLFEGNDLSDARRYAEWQKNPISKESLALRYTKTSLIARLLALTMPRGSAVPLRLQHKLQYKDGTTGSVSLEYSYIPDEPAREPLGFAETKSALEAGYRLCQSRGIKLVVIFVPIKVRVLEPFVLFDDQNDKDQYLPGGAVDSERDFAHEAAKFCRQLGCPFIDTTGALRRRAAEDNHFIYMTNQDSHLDVEGHKAVAETLEKWLQVNLSESFASEPPQAARVKLTSFGLELR